jgi:hypothetical protein
MKERSNELYKKKLDFAGTSVAQDIDHAVANWQTLTEDICTPEERNMFFSLVGTRVRVKTGYAKGFTATVIADPEGYVLNDGDIYLHFDRDGEILTLSSDGRFKKQIEDEYWEIEKLEEI